MANGAADFERLARQYWGAWGDSMRGASPGTASPGLQAWQEAVDWWAQYAQGGPAGVDEVLARFNSQARDWYGQMQQLATRFAGRDSSAGEIAAAWKQAMGAAGLEPFTDMLRSMRGQGLQDFAQWADGSAPWLDMVRSEGLSWLKLPAFGFAREHQERLQALAQAQVEYQTCSAEYNALMRKASQAAFDLFEGKLAEREEPGRQIDSPRALFDLWIDAAEEAYAEIALSQEFREAYGKLVNAQMRLRAGVQREVEQACAQVGMPTRTEMDAAHRKIVELERTVRRMRDAMEEKAPAATKPATRDAGAAPVKRGGKASTAPKASSARGKKAAKTTKTAQAAPVRRPASKRPARKLAPKPSVSSRRAPTNGFSSGIPTPVAPLPMDGKGPTAKGKR